MESMETREMDVRFDADTREVVGMAVPYGQVSNGEQFQRGAVTLDPEAKLFWQHKEPVGKIVAGEHTDAGFMVRAKISDTTLGNDVHTLLKDGVINKMSVGFIMRDAEMVDGVRQVKDAFVREVSLVPFPWYEGANVTAVRDDTDSDVPNSDETEGEIVENETPVASDLAEVREAITMLEREVASINKVEAPAANYRSAGEFLKAIADGDENALRVYAGATTADSITTPVDVNLIRLVESANPLGSVFGRGVTPADGMTITFARVEGITDGTADQGTEGSNLGYYELRVGTDSVDIVTKGNYAELSRQAIDRSTVAYLDSVLRGQALALGNALAVDLRTAYQDVCADQVTATHVVERATEDYAGWVGAIADAQATYFQPAGASIDALVVATATFKDLVALDGSPVITFSGEANGAAGSANPSGLRGTLAGIPIVVDAGLAADGSEDAFVSSLALRQYTSGALRLSQDNAINLSSAYSVFTYTATAAEFPALIIPVVAAA